MKKYGVLVLLLMSQVAQAALGQDIHRLQVQWAQAYYQLTGDQQQATFESAITAADKAVKANPGHVVPLIWRGILKATYAGVKGGLGALSLAKEAKADMEKAIAIDPDASGSAYATLATLYFRVPGWPIGFGDDDKAEQLFKQALKYDPDSIDTNYLYAEYLIDQHRYQDAEQYLQKAQHAPARPDRPLADKGRHQQIAAALKEVHAKIHKKIAHNAPF